MRVAIPPPPRDERHAATAVKTSLALRVREASSLGCSSQTRHPSRSAREKMHGPLQFATIPRLTSREERASRAEVQTRCALTPPG